MSSRVSKKDLEHAVEVVRRKTEIPLGVDWAYGQPEIVLERETGYTIERVLSPRMSTDDCMMWLDAFLTGWELGQG